MEETKDLVVPRLNLKMINANQVLVLPYKREKTAGGVILPEDMLKDEQSMGFFISSGNPDIDIPVGALCYIVPRTPFPVVIEGYKMMMLYRDEVLGYNDRIVIPLAPEIEPVETV